MLSRVLVFSVCLLILLTSLHAQERQSGARVLLTPQEQRGKTLYLRGQSASGHEVIAIVGEIDMPATTVTCAGCHGEWGEGKTEGGVTAGNLQWSDLTKSEGHTHSSGRKHGAFNEKSFASSLANGVDSSGNSLQVAMPRYKMAAEDMADLIAYLKRIETDRDPGITDSSIRVGLLVPATGALAEMGQAIRAVTSAYFEEINRQGGIHGRKLELKTGQTGATSTATAANLERLITNDEIFALANVVTAGADSEIVALVQKNEVPLVGAITLAPQIAAPINRQVFYLLPGVAEQARALVSFAAQKFDKSTRIAIIYTQGDTLAIVSAKAVDVQCQSVGFALPPRVVLNEGPPDVPPTVIAEMKNRGIQAVYIFSKGVPLSLLKEAEKANFFPDIYLPGASAGPDILNAPVGFKGKIFLAFPTAPSDISTDGMSNFRALGQKYQLPQKHVAAQLSAYVAAQLFVEGLKLAGRDLSREKLITSLEGLHDYQTGLTPAVTFGPNRRVGALGAHIISVDLEKKQFAATGVWVGVNP